MKKIIIKKSDKADVLSGINYDLVRSAIVEGSFESLVRVFEYFKATDAQIGSELFKRKVYVSALPIFFESEDKAQNEFMLKYLESIKFKKFLFACTAAIAYGFAPFIKQWQNTDGEILPQFSFIAPTYFNTDREDRLYLKQSFEKLYVDENLDLFWLHFHPTDSGDIITQSLMYRIVTITALKHLAISKYMSYFDSLSVPPLVVKSDSIEDESKSSALIEAAVNLRANGVGLFSKDDILELLNGNVDKSTFLEFIKYCDDSISKSITGQVLAGNSQANGTQALGKIHNEVRQDILRFDAMLIGASIYELINEILVLNFANVKPFKFMLDANLEADEEALSAVYEKITNMGYEIPVEFMETTFKIKGLKLKSEQNEPANNASKQSRQDKNAKSLNLPLDNIDAALASNQYNKADKEILKAVESSLNTLLKDSSSYEEAFKRLGDMYQNLDTTTLEDVMMRAIANAQIYGSDE
nr:MAG TPA: portal [Caudoviricetes sp.]DAO98466.1 MAG TPA: portal [Caudoviricetes sp.]